MVKAHGKRYENFRRQLRVFFGRGFLVKISFTIIILFIFLAIFASVLTPYSPYEQSLVDALQGPSLKHLLGTDNLGRDLLTRLLYGARISMGMSVLSSIWAAVIGIILGLLGGYFRGFISSCIMRFTDAHLSIPPLLLTMVLAGLFGGNLMGISFVIGFSVVPTYVRVVYGLVLSLRENDYVTAAALVGQSDGKILLKHLLPNCFASLIVIFTMNLGTAIMIESSLSYLGIGITAPEPAWGTMVSDGYKYLLAAPHLAILPGVCLLLLVVSFNIVGDGLRDALDPRLRGKL